MPSRKPRTAADIVLPIANPLLAAAQRRLLATFTRGVICPIIPLPQGLAAVDHPTMRLRPAIVAPALTG
jgi:hypothetical protein